MSQLLLKSQAPQPLKELVSDALDAERRELLTALAKTEARLSDFEQKYGLSTQQFLSQPASSIEEMDALEWQGENETLKRLKQQLKAVEEIEFCS